MQGLKFKGPGLKTKILLGLSGFLILTIAFNLLFSNHLLTEDKKAYILENALNATEDIKKIFIERIQVSLFQSESLIHIAKSDKAQADKLFEKQKFIEALTYTDNGTRLFSFSHEQYPEFSEEFKRKVDDWINEPLTENADGIKVKKLQDENVLALTYSEDNKSLRILINMNLLWSRISGDLVFKYVINNEEGNLWKTDDENTDSLMEAFSGSGNSMATELTINNVNYLASTSTLPDFKIQIISFMTSEKAYAVLKDLALRFIAFGLIILGIALICGVFFSMRITNPINALMNGATHIANGDFSHQVEVKSKDEFSVLASQFNFMSGKIKDLLSEKEKIIEELREANAKIEDYSHNLELKVEQRTAELKSARDFIQTMVDSLDQGLFVIDKDLQCAPVFTKACQTLFGKSPAERTYTEVLNLNEEEKVRTGMWADIVFNEKLPFDSAVGLGLKEKVYNSPEDPDYKVLKLSYYPIRNEEGVLTNLVTVATDKTEEVRAIEENRRQQMYVEMIFKILANKVQFIDLDKEIQEYLHSLDELFEADEPDLEKAMLIYHTITGGLGMYAVDQLVTLSRSCEQTIVDMKKNESVDVAELRKQKEHFKESYLKFREETFASLGFKSNTIEVDKAIVLYLSDLVNRSSDRELKYVYDEHFMKVPAETFLSPYKDLLNSLSLKLNKAFAPLEIVNGDLRVSPNDYREFFSMLVHLIRNCADHGIESPEERMAKQKPIEGKIKITCEAQDNVLKVIVEDDGRGINPERIRAKLSEKNPDYAGDESDEEVIYHIFDHDFSTAEQVTTISGRGVGMSAIKDTVEKAQGRIIVDSKPDNGTKFIFELPLSS